MITSLFINFELLADDWFHEYYVEYEDNNVVNYGKVFIILMILSIDYCS